MTEENFKILLDKPASRPGLHFDQYAQSFAEIIKSSDARFAIGLFGGWGTGKTTLMEALQNRMDENNTVVVWFSAWRYEKEPALIVPLLDTIREALVAWGTRNAQHKTLALRTASTVGKVIRSLLAGVSLKAGLPGAVDLSFDANKALTYANQVATGEEDARASKSFYHASFMALQGAFAQFSVGQELLSPQPSLLTCCS